MIKHYFLIDSIAYQIHLCQQKKFSHWFKTSQIFSGVLPQENLGKLLILTNLLSPTVYELINECLTYSHTVSMLKSAYIKSTKEAFAWHLLGIYKKQPRESLDEFLQTLKTWSKPVTAQRHKYEYIPDSFIYGLQSKPIRQRLLENNTIDCNTMLNLAGSWEVAQKSLDSYNNVYETCFNLITTRQEPNTTALTCWKCDNPLHSWSKCPAKDTECFKWERLEHFSKNYYSKTSYKQTPAAMFPTLSWLDGSSSSLLSKYAVRVSTNNCKFYALIGSDSTDNFIHQQAIDQLSLNVISCDSSVSMISTAHVKSLSRCFTTNLKFQDKMYDSIKLSLLDDLCVDNS